MATSSPGASLGMLSIELLASATRGSAHPSCCLLLPQCSNPGLGIIMCPSRGPIPLMLCFSCYFHDPQRTTHHGPSFQTCAFSNRTQCAPSPPSFSPSQAGLMAPSVTSKLLEPRSSAFSEKVLLTFTWLTGSPGALHRGWGGGGAFFSDATNP